MSVFGLSFSGRVSKLTETLKEKFKYATVLPIGSGLYALNTSSKVVYNVASALVVEAGSTDTILKKTAHTFKVGDLIRLQTTANSIAEFEVYVSEIIDADNILLSAILSANLTAGDTYDHLRPVTERADSTGASMASVISPPLQFLRNAIATTVSYDTVTPSNSRPLPVQLFGVNGTLTLNADTLEIELDPTNDGVSIYGNDGTATPKQLAVDTNGYIKIIEGQASGVKITNLDETKDNVGIKNGANQLGIDASGNASTSLYDGANKAEISAARNLFTILRTAAGNILDITAAGKILIKSIEDAVTVTGTVGISGTVTTRQLVHTGGTPDSVRVGNGTNEMNIGSTGEQFTVIQDPSNPARKLTITALNEILAYINNTVTVQATDLDIRNLNSTDDKIAIRDGANQLGINASGEAKVNAAQLPTTIGQTSKANSLSVALASDQDELPIKNLTSVETNYTDFSSTNITNTGDTLVHTMGASAGKKLQIFMGFGEPVALKVNGTTKLIIPAGGFPMLMELSIPALATIHLRNLGPTATVNTGDFVMNILG